MKSTVASNLSTVNKPEVVLISKLTTSTTGPVNLIGSK